MLTDAENELLLACHEEAKTYYFRDYSQESTIRAWVEACQKVAYWGAIVRNQSGDARVVELIQLASE